MQKIVQLSEEEYNDLLAYKELHISVIKEVVKQATIKENLELQNIHKQCRFLNLQIANFREVIRYLLINARDKHSCPKDLVYLFTQLKLKIDQINLIWEKYG